MPEYPSQSGQPGQYPQQGYGAVQTPPPGYGAAPVPDYYPQAGNQQSSKPFFKRTGVRVILGLVVLVIAGAVAAVAPKSTDPKYASVGDCEAGDIDHVDTVKTVACTDPTATYKVIGTKLFQSESAFEAAQDPCSDYPNADASFWEGKAGRHGTVLCLQQLKSGS